jgi:hypothetical protein
LVGFYPKARAKLNKKKALDVKETNEQRVDVANHD